MSVNTANLTSVSATSLLNNETEDRFTGGFCSDDLWDTDLLVTSSWPRLTSCFLHTVLVYVPFACLWCPLPVYLYRLIAAGPRPLPISCLSVFKMTTKGPNYDSADLGHGLAVSPCR
ncbi:canalicular multispecific organic anion transporter 2 [Aplysia californica]|uniref:Canalicular multispecific organic anion transporter 2 n=1 Tax=Aplysia californica TaxID=6500 RepID=A0ABM1AD63_APLCA|nr:canalicular multispecific organic anion transporter 2 [Aplysia californica]